MFDPKVKWGAHKVIYEKDKKRETQPLSKLNLPLVEWIIPPKPQVYLGLGAMRGAPPVHIPWGPLISLFQELEMGCKKDKKEANIVLGRCLFKIDIPLSITKTNQFLKSMSDTIAIVGPRYKCHTYEELWRPILQLGNNDINTILEDLKSWEATRHTMMSYFWSLDRWEG